MTKRRHVNEFLKSGFANSGRVAGMGISHDNYSADSNAEVGPGCLNNPFAQNVKPDRSRGIPKSSVEEESKRPSLVITYKLEDIT